MKNKSKCITAIIISRARLFFLSENIFHTITYEPGQYVGANLQASFQPYLLLLCYCLFVNADL